MGFIKDRINFKNVTGVSLQDDNFWKLLGIDVQNLDSNKLGESTLCICLKYLSECVGKLPINAYQMSNLKGKERINDYYMNYVLNTEPNPFMNAFTFKSAVELNRNFFGNAYIYVETIRGKIKNLWILPSDEVVIWQDTAGIFGKDTNALWYVWQDTSGKQHKFMSNEIIHLKSSLSWNGITGLSIIDILKNTIDQARYGQTYLKNLYQNNMFGDKVILQYTGDLSPEGETKLASKIETFSTKTSSGKFIPLPLGITATTLAMKLSDAEFSVLNQATALQIAAAFGIKPNILNNYDKSSYSNSVTQQTDFFVNSLQPILEQYNLEFTRKLLNLKEKQSLASLEFNTKSLFKLDPVAQMDYHQKGINNAIMTPNEAREEAGLSYSEDDGANNLMCNGNYIPLGQVANKKVVI